MFLLHGMMNSLHVDTPLAHVVNRMRGVENVCDLDARIVVSSRVQHLTLISMHSTVMIFQLRV